jgi:hypothetical protein
MVNQEIAKKNIEKWFQTFKEKLVDDFPEYRLTFDFLISDAYEKDLLYNVFETAYDNLIQIGAFKGGADNLRCSDYLKALENAYNKWVK